MKKLKITLLIILVFSTLTGCTKSFTINEKNIKNYSDSKEGIYSDDTIFIDDFIEDNYTIETRQVHIEFLKVDSSENAKNWFDQQYENLKEQSDDYKVVTDENDKYGDISFTKDNMNYRILFSKNQCIYAYGLTFDNLNDCLKDLNIIKD